MTPHEQHEDKLCFFILLFLWLEYEVTIGLGRALSFCETPELLYGSENAKRAFTDIRVRFIDLLVNYPSHGQVGDKNAFAE